MSRVRKFGPDRKNLGRAIVQLEPDVAEMFPNADAVNEALRFLVRVMQQQAPAPDQSSSSEGNSIAP